MRPSGRAGRRAGGRGSGPGRAPRPEVAAVDRAVEAGHLDVHLDEAAQLPGERGHAGREVVGVGEHHDVGRELRAVALEEHGQARRADLLLALDQELEVDREAAGRPRYAEKAATQPRKPPCRRPSRARRGGPSSRRAGRAGSSTRRPAPGGRRRGGRRRARSARPARGASRRRRTGAPRAGSGSRRSRRRGERGRPRFTSADRRRSSSGNPAAETPGTRTSSRSASLNSGKRFSIARSAAARPLRVT